MDKYLELSLYLPPLYELVIPNNTLNTGPEWPSGEPGEFPVGRFTFGPVGRFIFELVEDILLLTFVTLVYLLLK